MVNSSIVVAGVLAMVSLASAVQPATWSHSTEADFTAGKLDRTVVTSLGEVLLARAAEALLEPREDVGMISAVAVDPRGRLYVAAAPGAKIYRLEKKKLVEFTKLPGVLVRYLAFENGTLIAGTCGKEAGLYRIDAKGKVEPLWTDKEVTYVWSVAAGPRGSYYVATGAKGKVYHVQPSGKASVIYDSDDENILSLAIGPTGLLYAGTGENGLIVEIEPARKTGRVLYDAPEAEISAMVVAPDGVIYAGTSDSTKAGATGEVPSQQEKGAPEGATRPGPPTQPAGKAKPPEEDQEKKPTTAPKLGEKPEAESPATAPVQPAAEAARPVATQPEPTTEPSAEETGATPPRPGPPVRPPRPTGAPPQAEGKGNAVYRIDTEGFVRPVFRRPVAILGMTFDEGVVMLGTGHGGQIFAVDVDKGRISMVVKLDPKDVTAMVGDGKGKLYVGTADQAAVYALGAGLAKKGTLVSKALDAGQIAAWGTVDVRADVPAGCSASIATRSGNAAKPDDKTWSSWSRETPVAEGWARVAAPAGRFLQYRLTLSGNSKATPAVDQVQLVYQVKNLPPVVKAVMVTPSGPPGREPEKGSSELKFRMVRIQAEDPNGDPLRYAVYFRRLGNERWIELTKKLTKPEYAWDTTGVADGVYEVRVVAADAPANPPASALEAARISRPVVVDNAPPTVTGLAAKPGKGNATLSGTVTDAVSRVVQIEYSVDTNDEWIAVLPKDGMCDSQKESFSLTVPDLEPGTHRLAVRAIDEYKNAGYDSVEVTVEK